MSSPSRPYQLIILCATVLLVYYSALFAPICVIDDRQLIFFYPTGTTLLDLVSAFLSNAGYYRPLLGATFMLDNYLWMMEESFLHLENVLLHASNALLLYAVAERLAKRAGIAPSHGIPFSVALLFALHPLATESVDWISGRTDPLACLFLLFSFKFLLDWLEKPATSRLIWMQLSFLLACLSKETAVFFIGPAVVLALVLRQGKAFPHPHPNLPFMPQRVLEGEGTRTLLTSIRTNWPIYAAFMATTLAYFALRIYSASITAGGDRGMSKLTKYATLEKADSLWFDKLMEVFRTIGFYSKKIVIPWPLNFNIVKVSDWYVLLGVASLVLLYRFCWRRRDLTAALLLSAYLVASSALLVSVGKLAWTLYAERYLYISLIFFIPASVLWLHEKIGTIRDGQLFRVVIILLCGASLVTTVQRNLVWMDGAAFYECNYQQAPDLPITMNNYASSLRMQGRVAEANAIMKRLPKKTRVEKGSVGK
jgi:hypothetical protein